MAIMAGVERLEGVTEQSVEQGDCAALYQSFYGDAHALASLLVGADEAADVAQDAFLRTFSRIQQIRSPEAFRPYLRRTVVTVALQRRRSRARERARAERASRAWPIADPTCEVNPDLWQTVQQLPPRQRAVIVLRYWSDLSETDIAAALGCRPGTVKSLASAAMTALRKATVDG